MDTLLGNDPLRWAVLGGVLLLMLLMAALGISLFIKLGRQGRSQQMVDRALAARAGIEAPRAAPVGKVAAMASAAEQAGMKLGKSRLGDSLLADEDRKLLDLAGFSNIVKARNLFIVARFGLAILLPVLAWLGMQFRDKEPSMMGWVMVVFFGFAIGWMLPKWLIQRRVRQRKESAEEELPLLIDLLRLLQGVGLSVDQSLHVLVGEFRAVMPTLAQELSTAIDLYARGRTREQSLARLATGFDNDDLSAICRLIVQVDKHGGAVQEPLGRFSERLRERHKLELKAKVARMTVKMTGVMVLTLLPALLIVTGGSGFVALTRGLSRVVGGQ
jgi:tight adherence protein C